MTQMHWALLVSSLSLAFIAAAVLGRRGGDAPGAVRRLLAGGAVAGGIALLLISLRNDT